MTVPARVFIQVKIIGQGVHPQSLAYRDDASVLDALLAAVRRARRAGEPISTESTR